MMISTYFDTIHSHRTDNPDHGLRYAYTVIVQTPDNKYDCQGTGHVDGEMFVAYRNKDVHKVGGWLQENNMSEERVEFEKHCEELKNEIGNMSNSRVTGVRTLQLEIGCKSTIDKHYAYDGENSTHVYINDTHNRQCHKKLLRYRASLAAAARYPILEVHRKVVMRQNRVRLRCYARDFYPSELNLHWLREVNGRQTAVAESNGRGSLPSGDGLYQKYIDITINDGEEDKYSCKAYGISTKHGTEVVKWKGSKAASGGSVLVLALSLPITVATIISVSVLIMRKREKQIKRHRRGSTRNDTSTPKRPSYRVNRHTEPPREIPVTIWIHEEITTVDLDTISYVPSTHYKERQ